MSKMHPLAMERWAPWNKTFAAPLLRYVYNCGRRMGDSCTDGIVGQVLKGQAGVVAQRSEGDSGVPSSCLWWEGAAQARKAGRGCTMKNPPHVLRILLRP